MATYKKCSDTEHKLLRQVIKECYPDITKADVKFDLLFVYAERDKDDNPKGPALKLHGVACAATIKKTNVIDRVCGRRDVLIQLDGDHWKDELTIDERIALVDHELCHIVLEKAEDETFIKDGAGRPIIELRNHDFDIGGFHEVIVRRGRAALEAQDISEAASHHGQLTFTFDEKPKKDAA